MLDHFRKSPAEREAAMARHPVIFAVAISVVSVLPIALLAVVASGSLWPGVLVYVAGFVPVLIVSVRHWRGYRADRSQLS